MNRVCLIYPYFGKFPNYFNLFLESARHNKKYDFHIYTDNEFPDINADNIYFHKDSLAEIKNRAVKVLNLDCVLNKPYKLCDYKPLYNLLFEETKNYEFWGFGDIDLILGNISKFVTDDVLNNNVVIGDYGHFMIMKNDDGITSKFLEYNKERIKKVFTTDETCGFDENKNSSYCHVFREVFKMPVHSIYQNYADIKVQYNKLSRHKFKNDKAKIKFQGKQIYTYSNGTLVGYFKNGKQINSVEILYIHFQKRPMKVRTKDVSNYLMIPNSFVDYVKQISNKTYKKFIFIKIADFFHHEFYWFKAFLKWIKKK